MDTKKDEFPQKLGKVKIYLLGLEFLLRAYLLEANPKDDQLPEDDQLPDNITDLQVGDEITLNKFTDYDTLGMLIDKYNEEVDANLKLDKKYFLDLRDALAHGRLFQKEGEENWHLMKFSKPNKGDKTVKVEFHAELTDKWLDITTNHVHRAAEQVKEAIPQSD